MKGKLIILGAFANLRKKTVSFVISVCSHVCPSAWNNLPLTGHIFVKLDI
jgi:hypothetical protein